MTMRIGGLARALRKIPSHWVITPISRGLMAQPPRRLKSGDKYAVVYFDAEKVEVAVVVRTVRRRH